jgi:serine/threonine protein kinase
MYGDLTLVADGESGGVYSAKILHEKGKQAKGKIAIKKIRVERDTVEKMEAVKKEMQLFSRIKNDHILVYNGIWLVEDANQASGSNQQIPAAINSTPHSELWVRMDLMERSLADLLGLLDEGLVLEEKHIARFAGDVVSGLVHLESLFIAHRDIRSDNLLISGIDGTVKIG